VTPDTETCPGCGVVLAPATDAGLPRPGASPSCARLFEVTLGGLREEAAADTGAAALARLAEGAYDAQHGRGRDAVPRLAGALGEAALSGDGAPPPAWTTTIADVAADLDVVDLPALVGAWARSVLADWRAGAGTRA
jgi:hypothetical protein